MQWATRPLRAPFVLRAFPPRSGGNPDRLGPAFEVLQRSRSNGDSRMTIEGLNSALEERGVVWQGSGFALVGAVSLSLLWVYSEADHWSIGIYRLVLTELNWAFVIALALVIEGIRKMFETRTAIRRAARE